MILGHEIYHDMNNIFIRNENKYIINRKKLSNNLMRTMLQKLKIL